MKRGDPRPAHPERAAGIRPIQRAPEAVADSDRRHPPESAKAARGRSSAAAAASSPAERRYHGRRGCRPPSGARSAYRPALGRNERDDRTAVEQRGRKPGRDGDEPFRTRDGGRTRRCGSPCRRSPRAGCSHLRRRVADGSAGSARPAFISRSLARPERQSSSSASGLCGVDLARAASRRVSKSTARRLSGSTRRKIPEFGALVDVGHAGRGDLDGKLRQRVHRAGEEERRGPVHEILEKGRIGESALHEARSPAPRSLTRARPSSS